VPNEEDRKNIILIANKVSVDTQWINYIDIFNYSDDGILYKTIGFILMRIRIMKEALNKIVLTEIRPNYIKQLASRIWGTLSKDFSIIMLKEEMSLNMNFFKKIMSSFR